MIHTKTVLVLGAGASVHAGFPTGQDLKYRILGEAWGEQGNSSQLAHQLMQAGITEVEFQAFRDTLRWSGRTSVDRLLEHRSDHERIGKIAIAACLLLNEGYGGVHKCDPRNPSWYEFLFGIMQGKSPRDFLLNNLAVITFNYDRSLEHYLHTALKNSFNLDDRQAAELLGPIPIVHVHGQLGGLPWQGNADWVRFGEEQATMSSVRPARSRSCMRELLRVQSSCELENFSKTPTA